MGHALITGASSGIGRELARLFARDGHHLVLVARRADRLKQLAHEIENEYRVETRVVPIDLSREGAAHEIFEITREYNLEVTYLVNNAGFYVNGPFEGTDWADEKQLIRLQCLNHPELTKLFLPAMIEAGKGGIMNVGSTGSFVPGPYNAVYCAAKAFVLSFSEALAAELSGTGIHVTALCPGGTRTAFHLPGQRSESAWWPLMDPAMVAASGYRALMQGRSVAVPGAANKLGVFMTRFLPRKYITRLSASAVKQTGKP